jgi:hypothetical protein
MHARMHTRNAPARGGMEGPSAAWPSACPLLPSPLPFPLSPLPSLPPSPPSCPLPPSPPSHTHRRVAAGISASASFSPSWSLSGVAMGVAPTWPPRPGVAAGVEENPAMADERRPVALTEGVMPACTHAWA